MRVLAIIPARGGSKGIPGKNIRLLGDAPLIAYSIAAALHSEYVDRVVVSTDSEAIAAVALEWGAEAPFLRPPEIAGDDTTDLPVFTHAVEWMKDQEGYRADLIVQLRPTSPLRPPDLIDRAVDIMLGNPDADSVRCVTPSGQNPWKMWRIAGDRLDPLLTSDLHEPYNMPRQALPDTFWQTGHVEVIRYETLVHKNSMTGEVILPCIVPTEYAVDLDNLYQWSFVEYTLRHAGLPLVLPDKMPTIFPV